MWSSHVLTLLLLLLIAETVWNNLYTGLAISRIFVNILVNVQLIFCQF